MAPKLPENSPRMGLSRLEDPLESRVFGSDRPGNRVYTMDRPPVEKFGETERVVCFNALNGNLFWKFEYPSEYGNLSYGRAESLPDYS